MERLVNSVTIPQLAKLAGVSDTYLRGLIDRGRGPKVRPHGKQSVVDFSEAVAWLEARRRRRQPAAKRRRLEDAITHVRVAWAMSRAIASARWARHFHRGFRGGELYTPQTDGLLSHNFKGGH